MTGMGKPKAGMAFRHDEVPYPIRLVCQHCGRSMAYDRTIDPAIPETVVKIVQPHCDKCWRGDREGETWFDAYGNEVAQ